MTFQFAPRPTFRNFVGQFLKPEPAAILNILPDPIPETFPSRKEVQSYMDRTVGGFDRDFSRRVFRSYIQVRDLLDQTRVALSEAGRTEIVLTEQLAMAKKSIDTLRNNDGDEAQELRRRLAQAKQHNRNQTAKVRALEENLKATKEVAEAQATAFRTRAPGTSYTKADVEKWKQGYEAYLVFAKKFQAFCTDIAPGIMNYMDGPK